MDTLYSVWWRKVCIFHTFVVFVFLRSPKRSCAYSQGFRETIVQMHMLSKLADALAAVHKDA